VSVSISYIASSGLSIYSTAAHEALALRTSKILMALKGSRHE
jgi:hypothetical protein